MPLRHEDKLLSLSGVNTSGLLGNWFWRVGLVARRSLITVRIVVQYALRCATLLSEVLLCYRKKNSLSTLIKFSISCLLRCMCDTCLHIIFLCFPFSPLDKWSLDVYFACIRKIQLIYMWCTSGYCLHFFFFNLCYKLLDCLP
jgi:hypothetical protein